MGSLSLSSMFKKLSFTTSQQSEFLDNYISLKGAEDETQSPDREVFEAMKEIYIEVVSEYCFEVVICNDVISKLSQGDSVSTALSPYLNRDVVLAFKATYEVGKTEFGIRQVIININQQNKIKKEFFAKIRKGSIIFFFGIAFLIGISSYMLPQFVAMVDISELDDFTRAFFDFGVFIKDKGDTIFCSFLCLLAAYIYSLANVFGKARDIIEKSPLFIMYLPYRSFAANRFFNMLTLLKSSGLSLRQSLEIIDDEVSPYMQYHIDEMLDMTRVGVSNLEQLDTGLLTPRLRIRLKAAGVRGGDNIDDTFNSIAKKASEDFEKSITSIGDQISSWLLIVGLGLAVTSILVIINSLSSISMSM
jgi:type II secretory pathway component PulF